MMHDDEQTMYDDDQDGDPSCLHHECDVHVRMRMTMAS